MIKKLTIAALMLALVPLSGCGDSHEAVMEDTIECMEGVVGVLETIKDKESAEAAKSELEDFGATMKDIQQRMKDLGEPEKDQGEALKKKYEGRMKELIGKLMKESMRIAGNSELKNIVGEAMKDLR